MNTVILVRDPLDQNSVEHLKVDNVFEHFMQIRADCPTARIYHNEFALSNDVTPYDQLTAKRFIKLTGRFIIVRHAAGLTPLEWLVFGLITAAISVAVTLLMPMPNMPKQVNQSPNNELGDRTNKARIEGRIPDIYGTRISTPDLIAKPYITFDENHIEVEHTIYVIGRGYYEIENVRDGDTDARQIDGMSVSIYDPSTSITGTPMFSIGDAFTKPPLYVKSSNSINGQNLELPNNDGLETINLYFEYPNLIKSKVAFDFTSVFTSGEKIVIYNAVFDDGTNSIDLSGIYDIDLSTASEIALVNPNTVNADWDTLASFTDKNTSLLSTLVQIDKLDDKWVGWFDFDMPVATGFFANLYYTQGLSWHSRSGRVDPHPSEIKIQWQQIDGTGAPVGTIFETSNYIFKKIESAFGLTVDVPLGFTGAFRFRLSNMRARDAQARDEVKIRDIFAYNESNIDSYDDVTVVRAKTVATSGALSVKERKLNLLGTRKLYSYRTGEQSVDRYATRNAADIIVNMALDQYIGRRSLNEVDVLGIYAAIDAAEAYFGTPLATEFCYTFDDDKMSFEESIAIIANAVFCDAYRMSNKLHLQLEKSNFNSKVLFNHRNKAPRSETRTITFGIENDHDGVEYEYTNPEDDSTTIISLPTTNLNNAKKIKGIGVRNGVQAHFAAWRAWHKLKYQYEKVRFTAYGEADLVTLKDRILVADNTRTGTQDGEIENVVGLVVTTSQPVKFEVGKAYTIHLQLKDGSVDAMTVSAGSDAYHLVLSRAPLQPLVYGDEYVAKTAYMITDNSAFDTTAYLVAAKSPQAKFVTEIEAVNYDWRYYEHDTDFINNLI